jgi:hypothetical protein
MSITEIEDKSECVSSTKLHGVCYEKVRWCYADIVFIVYNINSFICIKHNLIDYIVH